MPHKGYVLRNRNSKNAMHEKILNIKMSQSTWQEVTKSIKQFKMTPNEQKTHHLRIYVNDEKPRVDQHMISVP